MSVSVYHCLGSCSFSLTAYSVPGVNQRSAKQPTPQIYPDVLHILDCLPQPLCQSHQINKTYAQVIQQEDQSTSKKRFVSR